MTVKEIAQACLDERQPQMAELQKQAEKLNSEYEKLDFEESMYYHYKRT